MKYIIVLNYFLYEVNSMILERLKNAKKPLRIVIDREKTEI